MTVTNVVKDPAARTMTITSEFAAPIGRVWELWENPRLLERWWGPPGYPATVVDHDLTAGGSVTYYMTGPDGDTSRGWWRVLAVNAPHGLEFEDGFADATGAPDPDMPTATMRVTLAEIDEGTRLSIEVAFPTVEAMDRMLTMGMDEGMTLALGQIDDLLRASITES
jgi:uncharacterized protein YndB with AHSA1/START domain